MWTFVVRRTLAMLFAILLLTALIFFLMQAVLGDPVVLMLGRDADPDTIARLRQDLGFNRPSYVQYLDWLGRLLAGDWGRSFRTSEPVLRAILARLPVTLELTALSLLLALGLALALGILAAVRSNTKIDFCVALLTGLGVAMPNFWIAILLIFLFSLQLRLLPSSGTVPLLEDPLGNLVRMALPSITLSAAYFSNLARLTRAKMLEALGSDYVRTARAKGIPEARVLWIHALRNSLLPVLSVLGISISRLFGGAVVTETIFALPGVGILLVDSILGRDFPVVQGVIIVVAVGVFLTNFLVELAYAVVDPRVRIH
ncbi:MAG: ABC transporter permease [Candidatus Rokubacteria bacterium]|nr:ABC transporter permease [Candidatus Rokubacteria bacterium]